MKHDTGHELKMVSTKDLTYGPLNGETRRNDYMILAEWYQPAHIDSRQPATETTGLDVSRETAMDNAEH